MAELNKSVSTTYPGSTARNTFKSQAGFTGDHVTPLPYHMTTGRCTDNRAKMKHNNNPIALPNNDAPNFMSDLYIGTDSIPSWAIPAANKAYAKFLQDAMRSNSGLGETIAEWKQSLGLMNDYTLRMLHAWKRIRRLDVRNAIRALTKDDLLGKKRKGSPNASAIVKVASRTWLEYWFGIKPTMQSLYDTADYLSEPVKPDKAMGKSSITLNPRRSWKTTSSGTQWLIEQNNHGRYSCKMKADILVTSPNVALLHSVGLINPATLWELVPFSFLVDWVFDVGSFLSAFSDLIGCELSNVETAHFTRGSVNWHLNYFGGQAQYRYDSWWSQDCASLRRDTSLWKPVPNFQVEANLGQDITRVATSVALLSSVLQK